MQTLGTNLNTIGAQSYSQNFVDQLRAAAAGQASPWVSLFTGLLGAGAKNYQGSGKTGGSAYAKIGANTNADNGLTGSTFGLA
jgi:hypothetical protein